MTVMPTIDLTLMAMLSPSIVTPASPELSTAFATALSTATTAQGVPEAKLTRDALSDVVVPDIAPEALPLDAVCPAIPAIADPITTRVPTPQPVPAAIPIFVADEIGSAAVDMISNEKVTRPPVLARAIYSIIPTMIPTVQSDSAITDVPVDDTPFSDLPPADMPIINVAMIGPDTAHKHAEPHAGAAKSNAFDPVTSPTTVMTASSPAAPQIEIPREPSARIMPPVDMRTLPLVQATPGAPLDANTSGPNRDTGFAMQIVTMARDVAVAMRDTDMRFNLRAEALGSVGVTIARNDAGTTLHLGMDSAAALHLARQAEPLLTDMSARAGSPFVQVGIDLNAGEQRARPQPQAPFRRARFGTTHTIDDATPVRSGRFA